MTVFGEYANFYDHIYQDKDYQKECDILELIFRKFAKKKVITILDLGCGTGNHSFILHERGYDLTGVDCSQKMLNLARKKSAKLNIKKGISFKKGDIRYLRLNKKFDAVIMMFAVLGYQTKNEDIYNALSTVRRHLKKDGIFIFDVWYGPAVLVQKPSNRIKNIRLNDGDIVRSATTTLDTMNHICTVNYDVKYIKKRKMIDEVIESHQMRFFFPKEIEFYLKSTQLSLLKLTSFPNLEKIPDENSWNVLSIAKAI